METQQRQKLIKIIKELSSEEREALLTLLQEGIMPLPERQINKIKYPAEQEEIQYNGKLIDP